MLVALEKEFSYLIHLIHANVFHDGCSFKQTNSHKKRVKIYFGNISIFTLPLGTEQAKANGEVYKHKKNFIWWICCGNMMHKVEGLSDFVVFCIFHFLMYANDGIEKRSEILLKNSKMR